MAGKKPETFNDKENAALRDALRKLKDDRGWSQVETGRQLGIGQQAAGTILNRKGGFSFPTAEKLAELLLVSGPRDIISAAGATPHPMRVPQGWGNRDLAVSIARRLSYDEEVIRRVVVKYQEQTYQTLPAKWWNERIVNEAREQAEVAALRQATPSRPPAAPKSRPSKADPAPKRQRRAG